MHAPRLISIDQNDIADFDKEAVFLIQPQNPEFPIGQTGRIYIGVQRN